jgi:thioesterase domain-containing protein
MEQRENTDLRKNTGSAGSFFCMAEAGPVLARQLPDKPIHGIPIPLPDYANDCRIEAMAKDAVDKILAIQPSGPYVVGGYSGMAIIAYEVAQQLRTLGHEISLLVLFDPCPFTRNKDGKTIKFHFHSDKRSYPIKRALEHWRKMIQAGPRGWAGYIVHRIHCILALRAPSVLSAPAEQLLIHAIIRYQPEPFDAPLAYFITEDTLIDYRKPPYLGWKSVSNGGFELHKLPGSHLTLWREPFLGAVAAKLKEVLEATASNRFSAFSA